MSAPLTTVLVVEDEESFIEALTVGLSREGFRVQVARRRPGAGPARRGSPTWSCSRMLPRCRHECRDAQGSKVLIIMVTAAWRHTVVGLEVGADDYVGKPYRIRELVARMRAVLRRAPVPVAPGLGGEGSDVLEVGDVRLDPGRHEVVVRGEDVALPLKEFELLAMLLENAGRVLPREVLIDRVWGHDYVGDTKTLDVHVKRLRAKVEEDPSNPVRIVTIRGLGYKFETPRADRA
jgi:two-component system response regulator RegX3